MTVCVHDESMFLWELRVKNLRLMEEAKQGRASSQIMHKLFPPSCLGMKLLGGKELHKHYGARREREL